MHNIKLQVQYDGSNYHGYQVQPNCITIQGELERVLTIITKHKTKVIGAGRTDAGVHAEGQTVNFHSNISVPVDRIPRAMNSLLPPDIRVVDAQRVTQDFHSRFSAVGKTYRYQIWEDLYPSVFMRSFALWLQPSLDWERVEAGCGFFVGAHDFASFKASGTENNSTVRTVFDANVRRDGNLVTIRLTANGFLYNMVRNMVGTLVEVGTGKLPASAIETILQAQDRTVAPATAPAHGLILESVEY